MTVKGNNGDAWIFDDVMLWLWRRKNGDTVEWWRTGQGWNDIFIKVEGGSQTVRGGWPMAVVRIQYFSFGSRDEVTEQIIAERWNRGSELVFAQWERSMTRRTGWRRGGTGEGKREEMTRVELTRILLVEKIKKIHVIDSPTTNWWWRFKAMMC
jgi:hypothetical protein